MRLCLIQNLQEVTGGVAAGRVCVCDCVCVLYSQHCFYLNPTVSGANTPNTFCDSIFVFDFMKKKIHTVCFSFLSLRTDSVFLLVVWAPVVYSHLVFSFFLFSFALSIWLYWVISFLSPTEGCCCGSRCGRLIAWKLDFAPVWQTLQTIGGRPWKRETGLVERGLGVGERRAEQISGGATEDVGSLPTWKRQNERKIKKNSHLPECVYIIGKLRWKSIKIILQGFPFILRVTYQELDLNKKKLHICKKLSTMWCTKTVSVCTHGRHYREFRLKVELHNIKRQTLLVEINIFA